ncbi:CCA tRNA nucleotidyltransferase [Candidatus Woesearchaeota archaeon]|nr:CCA tRNA nucleotidyltransferase [Candidatus Woesearchaeota archaeon]
MELLKSVLKGIKPSKEEEREVKKKVDAFLKRINKGLRNAKAELGGSGAKETWLSKAHDADIFVAFNYNKYKDKSEQLSDILEKHLKRIIGKVSRLHGSRDYFQIKEKGFTFEVVPILKIKDAKDAKNITDVSPLHAAWVKKHKRFADEIRLTKQFCKAQGVYGAESYIKGFSGYICEILTVYYKGFMNLIKNGTKWKEKVFIDVERYYRNKKEILDKLNLAKVYSPLIIIDPVQKDRNAAAALNEEKYEQFICSCKEFLKRPTEEFFEIKEVSVDELKQRAGKDKLILLDVAALSGKEDVVGSKLLKAVEFIEKELIKKEFKVYEKGWKWDKNKKALFWSIVDKKLLSEYVEKQGPPVRLKEYVENFKKQYKGKTFVKKGKIFAKVKREFRDSSELVKELIKDKYVKEKVKSISLL